MHRNADGSWDNPAVIEVAETDNLAAKVFERAEVRPHQIIAERRGDVGRWHEVTSQEFASHAKDLARGLYAMSIRRGDSVAVLASTSYEWALLDIAILSLGAVTVPIYETDSSVQIAHIIKDAKVKLVITQTSQQAELVKSVKHRSVSGILSIDRGALRTISQDGHSVAVEVVEEAAAQTKIDDLATIIYTSGTTGMPKGVELTHRNFVEGAMQCYDILPMLIDDPNSRTLLFLPVAHVLARFVMHCILMGNGRLGFCPDTRTLIQDIKTFEPTMMLAVPRVLEKVYNSAAATAGKGIRSSLFSWSAEQARKMSQASAFPRPLKASRHAEAPSEADPEPRQGDDEPTATPLDALTHTSPGPQVTLRAAHKLADALVLRKVRNILGPNLHTIICGGAPLTPTLADFYRGIGITLLQGYGLSETTGPITVHRPDDNPPDSVGYLWPGNSMKIAPDGELLLKGISVTQGYHRLSDETAKAFHDGWFHTGDLGTIDEDGRLSIVGRKKELIVTAGGKNVSPEVLEHQLQTHPLIGHVVVFGDNRPYIGALVTLDSEMLPQWLRNKGLKVVPPHRAAAYPEVKASLAKAIKRANQGVSRAESIRRYRILNAEFTIENGYLTPSLKLKRHKVLEDYAKEINEVYEMTTVEISGVGGSIDVTSSENEPAAER